MRSRCLDIGQVLFLCVYRPRQGQVHTINSKKKEQGQYPAILTEKACSMKDLLYGFRENFSHRTQWVVPSGQDSSILSAPVANHSAQSGSSLLAHGASHIIKIIITLSLNLLSTAISTCTCSHPSVLSLFSWLLQNFISGFFS